MAGSNSMSIEEIELLSDSYFYFNGEEHKEPYVTNSNLQDLFPHKEIINHNYEVGVSMLIDQSIKTFSRDGLVFNLLVAGRVGCGKTTFINTMFDTVLIENTSDSKNILVKYQCEIEDDTGVKLKLNIIETPGFGARINNEYCWIPLINYLEEQMSGYVFQEEQPYRQGKIRDNRVHCCLYFIDAYESCVHPVDVMTMREISNRCNLVPVLSKSDHLTDEELSVLKQKIMDVIAAQNIKVCKFFSSKEVASQYHANVPYDIRLQRDSYHWQDAMNKLSNNSWRHLNNLKYKQLRDAIFGEHLPEFVESTESHYERYRQFILEFRMKQVQEPAVPDGAKRVAEDESPGISEYLRYTTVSKQRVDEDLMSIANPNYLRGIIHLQKRHHYMLALEAQREEKRMKQVQLRQSQLVHEIQALRGQLDSLRVNDTFHESSATLVQI
ncbi:septin SPR3 [Nakaseomyces bracarensis]|uniref:septin SPR3 n=1 Tax=Nakaseomyces bracarensis TaxID=273131 RepID=UPI0038715567